MNNFLEIINVPMLAGDVKSFELTGDYFEIIEAAYPVTVTLNDRNGVQNGRMANAEQSFYIKSTDFGNIQISTVQAQTLRIAYGSGEAGTRRTAGVVSVIDGGKARTLAGDVYGWRFSQGPLAANWNVGQIWNPAGSGRRLLVKSYSSSVAAVTGFNNADIVTAAGSIGSKLSGGAASVALPRGLQQVSAVVAGFVVANQVNAGQTVVEPEPFVILPGFGFVMVTDVNNIASVFTAHLVQEVI